MEELELDYLIADLQQRRERQQKILIRRLVKDLIRCELAVDRAMEMESLSHELFSDEVEEATEELTSVASELDEMIRIVVRQEELEGKKP